jgi:hypothetical protein
MIPLWSAVACHREASRGQLARAPLSKLYKGFTAILLTPLPSRAMIWSEMNAVAEGFIEMKRF